MKRLLISWTPATLQEFGRRPYEALLRTRRRPGSKTKTTDLTEVLRQFHFRTLLDANLDLSESEFRAVRSRRLQSSIHELRGSSGQRMDRLIDFSDDPLGPVDEPRLPTDPIRRSELLDAYRTLRLDHQIDYAAFKLSSDDRTLLVLSGKSLVAASDALAGGALTIALLISAVQIASPLFVSPMQAPFSGSAPLQLSLTFAIVGVAIRALRDGLQLDQEREQYQEVLQRLRTLRNHCSILHHAVSARRSR